ncbi:mechanosensitive ion channel family protein [Solitalea lacus]|uniref:mechanosensitive ion channel family protein n=1 Tax=Solitalea lacus TaxID=2911172 RepID=UPI001EDB5FE7|nr:mechanosensitive ion channel family protein [Solitalea lacus]UKJ08445.1 mechanosensitive ion channel family protein [Solitalea lacus]
MHIRKELLICLSIFLLIIQTTVAQTPDKAPIVLNNDTLFYIYNGFEGITIKERAKVINIRLETVTNNPDFNIDSLKLIDTNNISVIYYKERMLMMVSDEDALKANGKRKEIATQCFQTLKAALNETYEDKSIGHLALQFLEVFGVIVVVSLLIWLTNKLSRLFQVQLLKHSEIRLNTIQEKKGLKVSYTKRVLPLIAGIVKILRIAVLILIIYMALPVLFSIFPWTEPIAGKLLAYVLTPLKKILVAVIQYIPNLLTIIVIYLVTRYILRLIHFVAEEIANGTIKITKFYPDWALPTYNIVKFLLYAFMFVVIFPYLPGSESKVFQGVTVFLGVLFSLGSSSAIANMVSGVVLTYMRPYKIGDRVKIGEVVGDVIEKNLLITRIRTIKNEDITVPNSTILSNHSINYSSSAKELGLILNTSITLTYDTPWNQVYELMISAALRTDGIMPDPKPFVLQTALNDFYVSYQINAYTQKPQQMANIYSQLHQNLQDTFNENGVEIMSPHVFAVRDGSAIQIPDQYKPHGYQKPGIKIDGNKP